MADDDGKRDRYEARVTAAIEHLRGNVKWTLVAFGAIGTTLLAGSQLSNLGKFQLGDLRLTIALVSAGVALGAAAAAIYWALRVAYTGYTEFYSLDPTDVDHIEANPALLEGFASVAALRTAYEEAVAKRHRDLTAEEKDSDLIESNQYWFEYLDELIDHLVSYARYNRIRREAERTKTRLTLASVIAAVALVSFAWAANPGKDESTVALRSPPSQAKLSLTTSGRATLLPVLGEKCAARESIDVILIGITTANAEVVTLANGDCPVLRITLTPGMGKVTSADGAAGAALPVDAAALSERPIVWTQLRPNIDATKGELIARAIVAREAPCPPLTVNGATWPMETRADGTDADFPIRMCEAAIPGDAKATLAGVDLKLRPLRPRKIVVIGDTGCRITDYNAQACDRASEWPFFRVAAAAAKLNPDLIIHVGDYHYREKPCAGQAGCTGSPYGDTWPTWKADFFAPAGALLNAAPWLMVRGNHEDCTRAGAGWNLLVRPELGLKPGERCPPDTDPYVLEFNGLRLVVLDSASTERYRRDKRSLTYRKQLRGKNDQIAAPLAAGAQAWLLLHHPLWGSYGSKEGDAYVETDLYSAVVDTTPGSARDTLCQQIVDPVGSIRGWLTEEIVAKPSTEDPCSKLAKASAPLPSPGFAMVLSGHVHNFQMFVPDDGAQPVQVVAGNSGDDLETGFAAATGKFDIQSATLFGRQGKLSARNTFGFTVLEKPDDTGPWMATLYDPDGKVLGRCRVAAGGTCTDELR